MMKQFAFAVVGRLRRCEAYKLGLLLLHSRTAYIPYPLPLLPPCLPSTTACCALRRKNLSPGASILIDDCLVLGINYNSSHFVLRLRMDSGRKRTVWAGGGAGGAGRWETMAPASKPLIDWTTFYGVWNERKGANLSDFGCGLCWGIKWSCGPVSRRRSRSRGSAGQRVPKTYRIQVIAQWINERAAYRAQQK